MSTNIWVTNSVSCKLVKCFKAPGYSIPALAHKVVQNWDDELTCYIEAIRSAEQGYKAVSLVIDTTSSRRFIDHHLLKVQEIAETYNIKPIYRPDSGDCLAQAHFIAPKLNGRNFGIIIGDSITFDAAKKSDEAWEKLGHSCDLALDFTSRIVL
jgi:hypothetical protein